MDLAKQLGRSALALALVSLSGCQLLQFGQPTEYLFSGGERSCS